MTKRRALLEIGLQLGIGLLLIFLGLWLNDVIRIGRPVAPGSEINASMDVSARGEQASIHHHLGTAILTAGILLITVELFVKLRELVAYGKEAATRQAYLDAVRAASHEALLRSMLPHEAILDQLQVQILRHQSIRRDFRTVVHFRRELQGGSLIKTTQTSFRVENGSSSALTVPLRVAMDADSVTDPRPKLEKLRLCASEHWAVGSKDGRTVWKTTDARDTNDGDKQKEKVWNEDELVANGVLAISGNAFSAHLVVTLAPHREIEVEFTTVEWAKPEDEASVLCLVPTLGLTVEIHPDVNMELSETFFHPSGTVVQADQNMRVLRIRGAVLPYQGLEYRWSYPMQSPTKPRTQEPAPRLSAVNDDRP